MAEMGFKLTVDNSDLIRDATDEALKVALSAIGMQAEGYAKMRCRVDTGLLRNSITWGLNGKEVNKDSYQSNSTHAATSVTRKAGTSGKHADVKRGVYSGNVNTGVEYSVAVGSNVYYAPYVELGTSNNPMGYPFLRPAFEEHMSEYKKLLEEQLANVNV